MRIAEIFRSIQGEGALTGVPSVFVRTSGCNLRCRWCDTPYASWSPEGEEMDVAAILAAVRRHATSHVVLTGGEPMVAKNIHALASALRADGRHITIETAGTIAPGGVACDLASLSPKLRNSAPANDDPRGPGWRARHESVRRQPGVVRAWIEKAQASGADFQLKFVVDSPDDTAEVEAWLEDIGVPVPPHKVFLMPEGVTIENLRLRAAWLAEICAQRGFRYAHRLQIELFGNTRGT